MEEIKSIDNLGRIVIPKSIRRKVGITSKDFVILSVKGKTIIIKKSEEYLKCPECNEVVSRVSYCPNCGAKLEGEKNEKVRRD